jgi:hypothetical protein
MSPIVRRDTPVQMSTKFELAINLKLAKGTRPGAGLDRVTE